MGEGIWRGVGQDQERVLFERGHYRDRRRIMPFLLGFFPRQVSEYSNDRHQ